MSKITPQVMQLFPDVSGTHKFQLLNNTGKTKTSKTSLLQEIEITIFVEK